MAVRTRAWSGNATAAAAVLVALGAAGCNWERSPDPARRAGLGGGAPGHAHADPLLDHAVQTVLEGRKIFRFDTFGDEAFWGGTLDEVVAHYDRHLGLGLNETQRTDLVQYLKSL
jgi:hypothetical protein